MVANKILIAFNYFNLSFNNLKFGENLTSISYSKAEIEVFKHKGVLIFAYLSF